MRVLATVLAIASGVIVLLGYFYPVELLLGLRIQLTNWALVIAAMAVLVGIVNLVSVQMEKIRTRQKGAMYGWVLIGSLVLTFFVGIIFTPSHALMRATVETVIIPVEASLMAILAVTLIYASIRLLRRRTDVMSVVFLVVALLSLTAVALLPFSSGLGDFLRRGVNLFSTGGARGLLIGVALGTLLTGLRVIFGVDRPYGGN